MSEIERLATAVGLSARQREMLAALLAEEGIDLDGGGEPAIPRLQGQEDLPLSFSQQRLWFLQRLEPESPFYNIAAEVRLTGELAIPVLGRALGEVVRRHEVLRSAFVEREDGPWVRIAPPRRVELPVVDLSGLPAAAAERLAGELTLAEARRGFGLAAGLLLRVLLLKVGPREHRVILSLHHVIADGWSLGVLVQEVGALYAAFQRGGRSPLPELAFQYADFAAWQRGWLQGEVLEKELAHWRARLEGAAPVLELPLDHPRPARRSDRGATRIVLLPTALAQSVEGLSRREGVSLFMTLLAAFFALLERHTGQRDLVVGYPVANRDRSDIEGMIGLFLNTLVLRVDLAGDPAFQALLGHVRDEVLEAQSHSQLPFERLVEELRLERSLSHNPLFQVLFVLQNTPASELAIPGLTVESTIVDLGVAQFDLSFRFEKAGDTLLGRLEYSQDLFETTTIERLLGHFTRLLAGAVADPQRPLSQLPLLSPGESQQILGEWNDTATAIDSGAGCLHERVAAQAARTPEAVAASCRGKELTYRELMGRARQLARHLISLGVGPDGRVGVLLERSLEMIVALLGVLEAGAAYVPLDPTLPAERLDLLVATAGLALVLSLERHSPLVPAPARRVLLDTGWSEIAEHPATAPAVRMGGDNREDNLAYVLYTSGSTGQPKGVMIPHRGIVNRLLWMQGAYGLTAEDRVLQKTPFGFDVSLWEFFWPLLTGARLVFARPEGHKDPEYLVNLIAREGITTLHFVPSMLEVFLEAPGMESLTSLRRVMASGEALPPQLVRRFLTRLPGAELHNLYGPTEASVDVSSWRCVSDPLPTPVPIGRPIANLRLHVVDRDLRLQPIGAHGELLLGGIGLARGYLGRPDLTAAVFIPDPFGGEPGGRLYRTGDLVRQLPDGNVQFLGRLDHQVKIRGFRIELGEIEAALARHPDVREAVVLVREEAGDKRLVAYVAPFAARAPLPVDLRRTLSRSLPEAMVPALSDFVLLESLPLTANGKVDRRALSRIAPVSTRKGAPLKVPRGPIEEKLAEIFAEVLKLPQVGADAHFFDLGGHSLLATQVVSRLRYELGVEVPLRVLFAKPVLGDLAQIVAERRAAGPIAPFPREAPDAVQGALLSFAQQRLWFLDQLEPASPAYNISSKVELRGRLDVAALASTLREVVRRHEALRTTFPTVAGQPVQVIAEHAELEMPVIDLRALPSRERKQEAGRLTGFEARRPFDLGRGPLLRVALLSLGAVHHIAVVTMHHIVSDGWSMGVLVREVGVLYAAILAGAPRPLPELPMQYASFAVWQRQRLSGELLEAELAWWRRQLSGMPPALELPADHPRPAALSGRGGEVTFKLNAESLAGLTAFSRQHGVTLFMTLLTSFLGLLRRYTGEGDLAVGTPIAGRVRIELEPLIGLFVNTLALRVDAAGDPEVAVLLDRVRETTLSAYAHQEVPFERLVEDLAPERDLSRSPLVQVLFVVQNAPTSALELPGLALKVTSLATGTTKLDLTCNLVEIDGVLEGTLEYSLDLFDRGTVERMAGHLTRLLVAAVAAPHRRLSELPLLSDGERQQLLGWSSAPPEPRREATLTALWEAQVRRDPEAPALTFELDTLSYGDLNRRANRLAWQLRRLGVGPESRVGLLLDRSFEQVVGILGTLKAGGAYVPLDPKAPAQRLAYLCADAGLQVLITGDQADLPPVATVIRLEKIEDELDDEPGEDDRDLPILVMPGNLCYVIYTSGSTGSPKGVLVSHGQVARLLAATEPWFGFGPGDVWTLFHSYSFDFSVWELWGALAYGGRLVIVPYWVSRSPEAFWWLLVEEKVTVLNQTPSAFRQLVQADGERTPAERRGLALRWVVFGGEALDLAALAPWYERHAADTPRLVNMYGITETTVHVSYRPLEVADLAQSHRSPIGVAIPDLEIRVLDEHLGLVPVGVMGEICVGGAGLARGYLGRPELTAERFVPDPFSGVPGARLYRSGDLARYRPDGELEYLGRRDHQVKVRGFRIELGEIEASLLAYPGVRSAVVLPHQDASGSTSLVAYVEAAPGRVAAGELRESLRSRLPEYMVPGAFLLLGALPLTVNGKLDRKALTALSLEPAEEEGAAEGEAPRTPTEEIVARIFAEVLSRERVGATADFFALGGHSLLATQVVLRLQTELGVDLPVRAVFEAPVVAALAGRVDDLLASLAAEPRTVTRAPRQERLELSFAQQRLWFLDQLEPGRATYNIPAAIRLTGALDRAALAAALTEIVRRHEVLRTTFQAVAGEPAQVVSPPAAVPLPIVDLGGLPAGLRDGEAERLARLAAQLPFDLERGPVLRASLLALGAEEHVALLVLHHIASDGWSIGVLVQELGALYAALRAGAPSPLPELPMQYADFAAWQRRYLAGGRLEAELAWWREALTGMPPTLELPADHPRPPTLSGRGRQHLFAIPGDGFAGLTELSRQQGVTLFMTLLTGFIALLRRYTGEDDLVVGSPIAGRTRMEIEPLIGLFVNTLVLRVDAAGDPDAAVLLGRVRETTLSAYAHQEVPFERLVEELVPWRDLSRPPLVQVLFGVQNAPLESLKLPGLELENAGAPTGTTKLDLTCTLMDNGQHLAGTLEYSEDLFDAPTIERLAGHLTRLLAGIAAEPHRRLSELPLLSEAESRQLLGWSAAAPAAGGETTLTALFAAQVRRDPAAPAVTFQDETLTYGELDRRANRLAWQLRRLGIGPESRVGLLLDRSFEQVVGILGILKAGGAYVPLDPAAPAQRLEYLCADSGLRVLVTDGREELPPAAAVVRLGAGTPALDGDDRELDAPVGPDNLCYVIYTSGSTGSPKGVLVSHGQVARLLAATEPWFGFGPGDVWTLFHSYSFDFSVWELWGALAYGGRLMIVPYWVSRSPEAFWRLLADEKVTVLNQTPSAFRQLIQADGERTPAERRVLALRWVVFGGEALDLAALAPWYERHAADAPRLVNMYGITETTVHVSYRPLEAADLAQSHRSPIGVAIPDLEIRVLDEHLGLVPVGVTGEICVGGAGLARGYLGRPELTAERFVPAPFGGVPGGRLYRSGDLARYRPDGELEYLGRRDHQVKVRGFRIELGEIEAALLACPGVRSAVVLPRQDASGSTSLAAYVEAVPGRVEAGELRESLRSRLPEYMVPGAFLLLGALPLTVNGKLDRKALAALPLEPVETAAEEEAPRTPTEEIVARIFAKVLSRERVGMTVDFFALGGHSLLATQVASRVQAALGIELAVRTVFEAPTVVTLAERIDGLLAGREAAEAPAIPRVPRDGRLELSFAQQRLWFLDQLEPGSAVYNIPAVLQMAGRLDVAVLSAALAEIVRRHEVLRTAFRAVAGEPVQVITAPMGQSLPLIDLAALPAGEREREADRLAAAEARRPFDLGRGPLVRAALLRRDAERHTALLTMHHIVSDGWSIGVLVRELGVLYAAFLAGAPSPLPELAVQYADFAAWQRQHLAGERLESELVWWRGQLAGMPPALELPVDHPRPATQSVQGAALDFLIGPEDLAGLNRLARQHGVTLFMVLLAGFLELLRRYTGEDDLAVGTPIAGRTRVEAEPLIGLFVNTLVLRVSLAGEPPVLGLLERVRETTLSAYAHQEVPFERLVEDLVPERDLSRPPLAQVLFVVQNAPAAPLELPGLALAASSLPTETAKFDLSCSLTEMDGGLVGSLEYVRDLFEAATIERLAGHLGRLLGGLAAAGPETPLPELPLLSASESRQILGEWNDTATAYPSAGGLHERVAAQAARTPEAVAASYEGESLTYRELMGRARQLARHLISLGVGPDGRVGVLLERSLEMIVALLGVLEAGAAYVPLDPTLPAERLDLLVATAGLALVLSLERHSPLVPAPARTVLLDTGWSEIAEHPATAPAVRMGGDNREDNLAYVLYTSGSTGQPKGVMIPHRGIVNRLLWMQEAYGLTAEDRVLQKTPFGFDVSLWEFFWPLLTGARLVFARPEGHKDPEYLVGLIAREGITTLHFVPSMLEVFLEAPGVESLTSLRRVMASGEALPPQLIRRFLTRLPGAELHNLYGPTEASVDVSSWRCVSDPLPTPVPIGRPIANLRLHVVDRDLRLQPVGAHGELLLGGIGLARGYLGRPDLTAAVFIPDPFGGKPGGRLYRTGDLVRQLPDGNVQFLGRLDHQVKIRGFRIELGEIEVALARHPAVREAVVLVREEAGDKRLVAYVVPAGPAPAPADLQSDLRRSLPDYMVPTALVFLEGLPVTANGKLDRRALSRLAVAAAGPAQEFTAPQGPVEEILAAIWAAVLDRERVGAHDDFFALGGHSLLATQVMSRVREAFRVEMPLRALFEAPTVAALAARVGRETGGALAPPLVPQPRTGDLPLSFAQQRLWFLDRLAPDNPFYNMFAPVRLTGALDREALEQAFLEIVRRHEALRTTFQLAGGRPVQVIDPAPSFAVPLIDLTGIPAAEPELVRLANEESLRPFDLSQGPLLRASLVRLGEAGHTLLVNVHHVVSDGWSMGILFSELAILYGAFAQGEPSPLPELPIQYADFALWQRGWLQGERLEAELDYWRRQLAGVAETLQLPYDHPRPALESFRGGMVPFTLPAGLMRRLKPLTRSSGATPSITLLAAFNALLSRYSGREDIAVGMAIANRTRREVEGLIGFFVNTLIARTDLTDAPGFAQLLARVRETALEAYAHQELPFERLVEELAPERDLGRNPLTQVMFGYQNFPRREMEVHGLVLSPPEEALGAARTAKFDLTLFLFEDGDGLQGSLEYNRELFEATTLQRLACHLENLLAAAAAAPDTAIALLPFFSVGERHQLAREWNDTDAAYPSTTSLQELFEEQVRRRCDEPALLFDDGEVSWGELNRRANRLAARLRATGVELESRVGLCVVRSPELIVGMLGIVKAGAAYVPLDPDYPGERLELMVEDSGVRVLVTQEPALTRLPASLLARVEVVSPGGHMAEPAENPPVTTSGESLAHVIYTSGSTGRPKGVCMPHRAVARLVLGVSYADLGPGEVFSQFAPVSFDPSTFEIWGALLNGSRLALAPPYAMSLEELGSSIERFGMTTVWLTTVIFHQFVEHRLDLLRRVPQVLAGGDALSPSHVRRLLQELPDTRLVNGYGPTENACFTTCYTMQGPEPIGSTTPLGHPMANTQVHLLDPQGQPVPIGVAGELCTGGGGLSRGYLGRPDLTAERFVPNPFGGTGREAAGSRLYRTGDLARYFPDGRVEFLGRIDHQVKIRGFRIELGEIEARLGEHPAVLRSVVMAREDIPGDRRLVAYVVPDQAYEGGEQTEQVSQWSELFDDLYRQQAAGGDPTFNIVGWNSTYTGLPLPAGEMTEWLEDTVERIAALQPRRVLEVGFGTGMILFRVAPGCEQYTATDISGQALEYVDSQLDRVAGLDRSRVQLLQGGLERLDGLAAGSFDTAILNSVAQYFPSADYLAEVVTRLVELVRPGGAVFLGDLRSLPLLEAFHTSLELFQAEEEMPLELLRQKVQTRHGQESELVIDPAFFAALRQRLPDLGRVEIHPKHGRAHNELTGFRYQAVLRVGPESGETAPTSWVDWWETGLTLAALRRHLEESRPAILGLRNVPNARVAEASEAVRLLRESREGMATAGDLRRRAAKAVADAIEPQDLWDLARDLPYEVELGWASPGADGGFEAVLRRRDGAAPALAASLPAAEPLAGEPLDRYTNDPLRGRFARRIVPELRAFLAARLPEYMVPAAFVPLDALPLSPSGKLDRRRLPAPDAAARPESGSPLVAPRNPIEEKLVEIWRELLGVERIGVDDDFFDLGGHSLLATQAVSRIRETFGVELPLRVFFETTTVAAVAAKVEDLRLWGGEDEVPPIVPVPRDGRLPLSFAQERLWLLHRLDTRTLAYNEAAAFRLEGRLDAAALRWSLDEILRRHESLRTAFPEIDGQAAQEIQPPAPFPIEEVDLRGLPAALREEAARELAMGLARRPFDLEHGPLVRGLLARLEERDHAVFLSFHHIVFDGWSIGVFVRELSALYSARVAGTPSPLPPLPVQYADFAAWQRGWLRGEALERQLAYWRERLAGVAPLDLATDRPRPLLPQAPSGLRRLAIPPVLAQGLRDLSTGRGMTLFMTLLAGFQALLHRYTGQDDVAVGSAIANRERGEVEKLIGFFVNMLVLRTDLGGDPTFGELLDRVRQTALGAYAHQSLPFEKLVEELRPDRDLRRTPLFQVSFQLLNVPAAALELPELELRPVGFGARSAKFDLELALVDDGEAGLSGLLDYDADLFDAATIERLLMHLERLLAGAVEAPGRRLSELPLLTPAERSQVVREWNDTRTAFPAGRRLHEMIADQVRRTPDAVALVLEEEEIRYEDLDARANRLAHALRRRGVGPGVRVGLCLERSPEMVVGLLGVLKAGGAYVPLDPAYPPERLVFMLNDARVPVLLTQERLRAALQSGNSVLCLDSQWGEIEAESAESPDVPGDDGELAYVIYTSGSTGRPKGAMNSHRAIVNRLLWMQQAYGLTPEDRVLQKTPFSFDVSVWEFFWPLLTGARLVLARPGGHQDPDYLAGLIARAGITTVHFVPSMLQAFLEAADVEGCISLRRVICSGEALTAPLARRFLARFPAGSAPALHNLYGPTEAAVDVTAWPYDPESPLAAVPIGRPIANTSALVLDAHLEPVPLGVPGELYLGGIQLARGYLDRPDLTAERFVPDPFAAAAGTRLYRTGDQVRRQPGGEIVYLGRLDFQVKVRGFRIELGEIESALLALPGVEEAVVIARADTPGDPRLVAYTTGEAAAEELRRQLRERLPDFMVPAAFVRLDVMPLNPSGKVDRKALPQPDRGPAPGFVPPRTPVEEALAEIWAEVLGRERVGVHDSFFDLGGHSLLAVLLMARIEKRLGKALPLSALFAAPTLETLAALVERSGGPARRSPLVAIKPQGERAPLFCVHPVGGNVLCYLDLARHLPAEQPFYAFQSPDPADGPLPATVEETAARYLRELRRVQPEGPYQLGGWSLGGLIAFEMARQLAGAGQEVELVALIDTLPPAEPGLPPATEEELVAWFLQDLARLLGHDVAVVPEELLGLPAREKLERAAGLAHAAGLLPADFGADRLSPMLATFAANLQASRAFVRRPYAGRVALFLAEQTLAGHGPELLDGWEQSALGGVEISTLPGDHYSLLRGPEAARLASELAARLAVATARPVS